MDTTTIDRRDFIKSSLYAPLAANMAFNSFTPDQSNYPSDTDFDIDRVDSNPKIKLARDIALKLLQPSEKHYKHGMELHKNSLVIEPYGFAPFSAFDGDHVKKLIETGGSDEEIIFAMEDMRRTRCITNKTEREEITQAWQASGVDCVFQNAGEESNTIEIILQRLGWFTFITDMLSDFLFKAVTPGDITKAEQSNRRCLYFSSNGVPLPQNWRSAETELLYIRLFFQLGIRMMHLTYNRQNMIGSGCGEPDDGGLTDFGRVVVDTMNNEGIIVDISHSGWKTSLEAAEVSRKPIVASHTICHALNPHYRGKPDNVMKAIADRNGLIGICVIPRYLGGTGDIRALLDHIDYTIKKVGVDHVGIATDVNYTSQNFGKQYAKLPEDWRRNTRAKWEQLWPPFEYTETEEMELSTAWTNWPLFTVGLVQRGYSDEDIQKIIGGNALRVARDVFPDNLNKHSDSK
ncbi:dipeptidase [Bacteroidota bacterium]